MIKLTIPKHTANIHLPLTHSAAGISTPSTSGHKAANHAVFLCSSFSAAICRVYSVMVGYRGLPDGRPVPEAGVENPLYPATQLFSAVARRLSNFSGVTVMSTNTPRANSAQISPLFNITKHRQPIAQNIGGALAMRFKRRYPACIVKFSGFEGVANG